MHKARVIADQRLAARDQAERLRQRGLARQVVAMVGPVRIYGRGNVIAQCRFLARAKQHHWQIKPRRIYLFVLVVIYVSAIFYYGNWLIPKCGLLRPFGQIWMKLLCNKP